jgi:hypothetical protein
LDVHENDVHADVRRVAYPRDFVYSSYVDCVNKNPALRLQGRAFAFV